MNNEQAIKILISVATIAQKGGLLTLADARLAMDAIELLEKDLEKNKELSGPEPETKENE